MRTGHFKTLMSDDFFFDPNQIPRRLCYAGQIGQWQNGISAGHRPGDKRTAAPIFPKQAGPKRRHPLRLRPHDEQLDNRRNTVWS